MKVGMIFECGPAGADKQVCEYLASRIRLDIEISSRTLDNKRNLLSDAGKVALELLKDGCCCVLILWDLRPAWPGASGKPCRAEERLAMLAKLKEAGIAETAPVYLVCVEQELESWLIANERALESLLSTEAHKYSVPRVRRPDEVPQPKAAINNHFKSSRGWRYDDKVDAIRILNAAEVDLGRLRRSTSFERFESKLTAC